MKKTVKFYAGITGIIVLTIFFALIPNVVKGEGTEEERRATIEPGSAPTQLERVPSREPETTQRIAEPKTTVPTRGRRATSREDAATQKIADLERRIADLEGKVSLLEQERKERREVGEKAEISEPSPGVESTPEAEPKPIIELTFSRDLSWRSRDEYERENRSETEIRQEYERKNRFRLAIWDELVNQDQIVLRSRLLKQPYPGYKSPDYRLTCSDADSNWVHIKLFNVEKKEYIAARLFEVPSHDCRGAARQVVDFCLDSLNHSR